MTKPVGDYYTIVCALDLTEATDVVVERALATAARHDRAEIHVVSVLDDTGMLGRHHPVDETTIESVQKQLEALLVDELAAFGHPVDDPKGWVVSYHVRLGSPHEEIVELAWEVRADLIVIGKHSGRDRSRYFLGAIPERVIRMSTCPVLSVQAVDYDAEEPPPPPGPKKRESARLPRTVYMVPYPRTPEREEPLA